LHGICFQRRAALEQRRRAEAARVYEADLVEKRREVDLAHRVLGRAQLSVAHRDKALEREQLHR
jgi:hypothetical protein